MFFLSLIYLMSSYFLEKVSLILALPTYFTSAPELANNISHPAKVFSGELYPNDSSVLAKFSSSNYVAWFNNESNSIGNNSPYLAKDGDWE